MSFDGFIMSSRCVVFGLWLSVVSHVESMAKHSIPWPLSELTHQGGWGVHISSFPSDLRDPKQLTSPWGWLQFRQNTDSPVLYHMHIPRTAGASFAQDMLTTLPKTVGIYSWETCFPEYVRVFGDDVYKRPARLGGIATMLRNPDNRVYSQYMANMSTDVNSMNFSTWLQHFEAMPTDGFSWHHQVSMQSRSFTCQPHDFQNESEHDWKHAVTNMNGIGFVGIMEHYQESLCLLHVQLDLQLPSWCNCEDQASWSSFKQSSINLGKGEHHVPELRTEERELLDNITQYDWHLYQAATDRFLEHIQAAEERSGVKILC